MKKLLYPAAFLLLLTAATSCRRDEKECDVANADQLHEREIFLNQREQTLNAREAALASRETGNGGAYANGSTYQTSSNAGYATNSGTTVSNKRAAMRKPNNNSGEGSAYTGTNSAVPGQYPEASERVLTNDDVQHLSAWGRKVMINEIYARHHYVFTDNTLQTHFNREYWYKGTERKLDKIKLSAIEKQNIAFLQ